MIIEIVVGSVIVYLGMFGLLCILDGDFFVVKYDYVDLVMISGKWLCYNDLCCFGVWLWCVFDESYEVFGCLGFELLIEVFNVEYMMDKVCNKCIVVKVFIMDNVVVVGVGNIYVNELLFILCFYLLCFVYLLSLEEW